MQIATAVLTHTAAPSPQVSRDALGRALSREPAAPRAASNRPTPMLAPWQARRVADHVARNLAEIIRTSDLASLARLTPGYFSKAFRGSFGVAPHAYITARRMEQARDLMLNSDEPLSQIALACGLYDQAHFTRLFRKLHGEVPGAWRRSRRQISRRPGPSRRAEAAPGLSPHVRASPSPPKAATMA